MLRSGRPACGVAAGRLDLVPFGGERACQTAVAAAQSGFHQGEVEQVALGEIPTDGYLTVTKQEFAQARQRAALVAPHQAGVADNVCGQDRRQFALLTGQWNFPALLQRIVDGLRLRGNRAGRRRRSQRQVKAQGQQHHGYQASLRLQRSTADDGSLLTALERNYPRVPFQWLTYRS